MGQVTSSKCWLVAVNRTRHVSGGHRSASAGEGGSYVVDAFVERVQPLRPEVGEGHVAARVGVIACRTNTTLSTRHTWPTTTAAAKPHRGRRRHPETSSKSAPHDHRPGEGEEEEGHARTPDKVFVGEEDVEPPDAGVVHHILAAVDHLGTHHTHRGCRAEKEEDGDGTSVVVQVVSRVSCECVVGVVSEGQVVAARAGGSVVPWWSWWMTERK